MFLKDFYEGNSYYCRLNYSLKWTGIERRKYVVQDARKTIRNIFG